MAATFGGRSSTPTANTPLMAQQGATVPRLRVFDAALRSLLQGVKLSPNAQIWRFQTDDANRKLVLEYRSDTLQRDIILVDRDRNSVQLFAHDDGILGHVTARTRPVSFPARDGLPLKGYLTVPQGVPEKSLPLVVLVHGGPRMDEPWLPDLVTLRLASRGYAVLRVAYRGTVGRGRRLIETAFGEWGGKMQTDVTDTACWAVRQGIGDSHRLAVMGGSYGGHAAMEALVQTPKLFAAAVSIAGPADLVSLVDDLTTWRQSDRDHSDLYMGTDPALRRDRSPIHHVDRIERPLPAYQGDKDEIVHPDQLPRMNRPCTPPANTARPTTMITGME